VWGLNSQSSFPHESEKMFVLIIGDDHGNGYHHSGDDKENLNRIG
ncbi:MAG: hypothetical protein RL062_1523, partial [Bacteroidota bacterium]